MSMKGRKMIPRISNIEIAKNYVLKVEFDDGKCVLYNLEDDMEQLPGYSDLKDIKGLFQNFQLDKSRTCVFWNDYIDLPSDAIYKYGKENCSSPS